MLLTYPMMHPKGVPAPFIGYAKEGGRPFLQLGGKRHGVPFGCVVLADSDQFRVLSNNWSPQLLLDADELERFVAGLVERAD